MSSTPLNTTSDEPYVDSGEDTDLVWTLLWVLTLIILLTLPFCSNSRRRQLCFRRLRERRWIEDDLLDEDDWYVQAYRRRNERRRQLEAQEQHFQTTKTQEDEIREQYLVHLLAQQSMTLEQADIHETSRTLERSSNHGTLNCTVQESMKVGSIAETETTTTTPTASDSSNTNDVESQIVPEARITTNISLEDDEKGLEEMDFHGTNEVVDVPLPGEKMTVDDSEDGVPAQMRRQVPSGCAVCLSPFAADEKISWSSNPDCSHVFHHDCLLHWYHEVGRRARKKQLRLNPNMSDVEALDLLRQFPKLCPCCRQTFCVEVENEKDNTM